MDYNGITWAADNGAQVNSMSLGAPAVHKPSLDAVNYAWSKGAVQLQLPGITVQLHLPTRRIIQMSLRSPQTDSNDNLATWSNRGVGSMSLPGVNIYLTYDNNSYATLSGTSTATPFVAGEAALISATGLCVRPIHVPGIKSKRQLITYREPVLTYLRAKANVVLKQSLFWLPECYTHSYSHYYPYSNAYRETYAYTSTHHDCLYHLPILHHSSGAYRRINTTVTVINEATSTPLSSATVKLQLKTPSGTIYSYSATTNTSGKVGLSNELKKKELSSVPS